VPFSGDYDGSIVAVLERLREIAGVEGLALLDLTDTDQPVLFALGLGGQATVAIGRDLLTTMPTAPAHALAPDRRAILACPWVLPPNRHGGLVLWRAPDARPWTDSDHSLAAATAMLLNVLLSTGLGQIGIDRLTGVPNRRWFLDEAERHIERLDGDRMVGTLSLIEIDNLNRLSITLGRPHAERVLVRLASYLRAMVRPGDVVARIAVDKFALWQTGMDYLTAAERAASLFVVRAADVPGPAGWPACLIVHRHRHPPGRQRRRHSHSTAASADRGAGTAGRRRRRLARLTHPY
jgi:GGDEF domain-containing protein